MDGMGNLYIDVILKGDGMPFGGLHFPVIGCPVPDVGSTWTHLVWND